LTSGLALARHKLCIADHVFRTRIDVLAGGGGWRELNFSTPSLLSKHMRPVILEVDGSSSDDAAEVQCMFFPSFNGEHSNKEEEVSGIFPTMFCIEFLLSDC
jgi:hypothetical protein